MTTNPAITADRAALREALDSAWKELIAEALRRNVVVAVGKHRPLVEAAILAATAAPEAPTGHTADVLRELLSRAVADMKLAIRAEFPSSRLIHRADNRKSSYDPLVRESVVYARLDDMLAQIDRAIDAAQPEPHAITGSAVHAAWRDGMLAQGREVAPERRAGLGDSQSARLFAEDIAAEYDREATR